VDSSTYGCWARYQEFVGYSYPVAPSERGFREFRLLKQEPNLPWCGTVDFEPRPKKLTGQHVFFSMDWFKETMIFVASNIGFSCNKS
jgi:hypothetical protein